MTGRAPWVYWPDFVPEPEHLDEAVAGRFADFIDAHADLGLGTIPTFIVAQAHLASPVIRSGPLPGR